MHDAVARTGPPLQPQRIVVQSACSCTVAAPSGSYRSSRSMSNIACSSRANLTVPRASLLSHGDASTSTTTQLPCCCTTYLICFIRKQVTCPPTSSYKQQCRTNRCINNPWPHRLARTGHPGLCQRLAPGWCRQRAATPHAAQAVARPAYHDAPATTLTCDTARIN
jgi:hypothetical protein